MNFREYVTEKVDYIEVLMDKIGADSKMDDAMWGWFEDNLGDSGIYAGDAVPEDYLEIMDDKQGKALYMFLNKKFKKTLNESSKCLGDYFTDFGKNQYSMFGQTIVIEKDGSVYKALMPDNSKLDKIRDLTDKDPIKLRDTIYKFIVGLKIKMVSKSCTEK